VPSERCSIEEQSIEIVDGHVVSNNVGSSVVTHHATRHNTLMYLVY
jgi:hypothetical protein